MYPSITSVCLFIGKHNLFKLQNLLYNSLVQWCITNYNFLRDGKKTQDIQLFRERLSEKIPKIPKIPKGNMGYAQCPVPDTSAVVPTFLYHSQTYVHGLSYHSLKLLWKTVNSKPPTIPFGFAACTLSDNLSQNSCIKLKGRFSWAKSEPTPRKCMSRNNTPYYVTFSKVACVAGVERTGFFKSVDDSLLSLNFPSVVC